MNNFPLMFPVAFFMWAYGSLGRKLPMWMRTVLTVPVRFLFALIIIVRPLHAYEVVFCLGMVSFLSLEFGRVAVGVGLGLGGLSLIMWSLL